MGWLIPALLVAAVVLSALWSARRSATLRAEQLEGELLHHEDGVSATTYTWSPLSCRIQSTCFDVLIREDRALLVRRPALRGPPIALLRPGEKAPSGAIGVVVSQPPEIEGGAVVIRSDESRWVEWKIVLRSSRPAPLVRALGRFLTYTPQAAVYR
jgi:hypothetical protein